MAAISRGKHGWYYSKESREGSREGLDLYESIEETRGTSTITRLECGECGQVAVV